MRQWQVISSESVKSRSRREVSTRVVCESSASSPASLRSAFVDESSASVLLSIYKKVQRCLVSRTYQPSDVPVAKNFTTKL